MANDLLDVATTTIAAGNHEGLLTMAKVAVEEIHQQQATAKTTHEQMDMLLNDSKEIVGRFHSYDSEMQQLMAHFREMLNESQQHTQQCLSYEKQAIEVHEMDNERLKQASTTLQNKYFGVAATEK